MLRPGGALALVATKHVLPRGGDAFWVEVQQDYEAVVPEEEATKAGAPSPPEDVGDFGAEIEASGLFRSVGVKRYLWDVMYSADEYIALLHTYSGHRNRQPAQRERLDDLIRARIKAQPTARVAKTYLATLNVAQKVRAESNLGRR